MPEDLHVPSPVRASPRQPVTALSVRSLGAGVVLGVLLSAANVYTTLKIGYIDGGSVTASLLCIAFFVGLRVAPDFSEQEVCVAQATSASAAVMAFVIGLGGPISALHLLGVAISTAQLFVWGIILSSLGILGAYVLQSPLIIRQNLPFPTGTATAKLITSTLRARESSLRTVAPMLLAVAASIAFVALRDLVQWIPALLSFPSLLLLSTHWAGVQVGLAMSPMMAATAVLMGQRVAWSVGLGSAICWLVGTPQLVDAKLVDHSEYGSVLSWFVWPAVSLMLVASLTTLVLQIPEIIRSLDKFRSADASPVASNGPSHRPLHDASNAATSNRANVQLVVFFMTLLLGAATWLCGTLFGTSAWFFVPLALLVLFSMIVTGQATGETDVAPVGPISTLAQFGTATQGPAVMLGSAALSSGACSQSNQSLWALRAAHILRTPTHAILIGQLLGAGVGAIVSISVYQILVARYALGESYLPAPAMQAALATAKAFDQGTQALPAMATQAVIVAAIFAVVVAALEKRRPAFARFLPSPVGIGIGIIMPAPVGAAIAFGALIAYVLHRFAPNWSERTLVLVATGVLAGESLMGIGVALWQSLSG